MPSPESRLPEVDYLEAHSVGSQLGDPIELNAVAAVYGKERDSERPLLIGSVKSNIGHIEWAAGIAAFIKTVLSLNTGVIPESLHFETPNPNVDWEKLPVKVASERTDWPTVNGRPPLAGVSAFGLSGANAHVVLEGYAGPADGAGVQSNGSWPTGSEQTVTVAMPPDIDDVDVAEAERTERSARVLPLSARSQATLAEMAGKYLSWLDEPGGLGSIRQRGRPTPR